DIAVYERVIYLKTASLIRTSARLGAMAADADDATIEALSTWAAEVGMVFQIADDALDLVATTERLGKPAGSDIREGKFTLPVLLALNGPDGDAVESLLRARPYTDESIAKVIEIVRTGGFVAESLAEARRRIALADAALAALPEGEARRVLSAMGEFLVSRVDRAAGT
ncbi:MAG: polyprenyl synthetase family protein, partial [Acidimicrobiia bacterium]|nr:polyprenyl synthetase family protein [Acidimicrobiia bacterium]